MIKALASLYHKAWYRLKRLTWLHWTVFLALMSLFVGAFLFAYWATLSNPQSWSLGVWSAICVNALTSTAAVLIGLSRIEADLQRFARQKSLGILVDFWGRDELRSNGFKVIYGGELGSFRDDTHQRTSLATIYSIQELAKTLGVVAPELPPLKYAAFTDVDATEVATGRYHIILLGGYLSIPTLKEFQQRANLPYRQDFSNQNNRKVIVVRDVERISEIDNDKIVTDYAVVTIAVDSSGRHLFWLSGNYGIATYGAVLAATRNEPRLQLGKPATGHYYQAIIRVSSVRDDKLEPDHPHIEICDRIDGQLPPNFSLASLWPLPAAAGTVPAP